MVFRPGVDKKSMMVQISPCYSSSGLESAFSDPGIIILQFKIMIKKKAVDHDEIMRFVAGHDGGRLYSEIPRSCLVSQTGHHRLAQEKEHKNQGNPYKLF